MFGVETIELQHESETAVDALESLAKSLFQQGFVKESYIEAIISREQQHPTGLPSPGLSIAIPHTDPEHVLKSRIAIATLKNPVTFSMMGSPEVKIPVRIVFMLAIQDPKKQPEVLKQLTKVFQNGELLNEIGNAQKKEKVVELLSEHIKQLN
jgi:galactitol PTS system EIIA component